MSFLTHLPSLTHMVSTIHLCPMTASLTKTHIIVTSRQSCVSAQTLIDSGLAGKFISLDLIKQLRTEKKPCLQIHCTHTLMFRIGNLHQEKISFHVQEGSTADVILGRRLWLLQHAPLICWWRREIQRWGDSCFGTCLDLIKKPRTKRSVSIQSDPSQSLFLNSTTIESPEVTV